MRIRQDDSRDERLHVVELIELGSAQPPRPILIWHSGKIGSYLVKDYYRCDQFRIVATRYNKPWPGSDSPWTFGVEGYGEKDGFYGVLMMWGFFNEIDCYDFLNGRGKQQYPVWDQYGNPGTSEPRDRLEIMDAYIRKYRNEAEA